MKIGKCELCGKKSVWVNLIQTKKCNNQQACSECFDKELPAKPARSGGRSDPAWRADKDYHGEHYRG